MGQLKPRPDALTRRHTKKLGGPSSRGSQGFLLTREASASGMVAGHCHSGDGKHEEMVELPKRSFVLLAIARSVPVEIVPQFSPRLRAFVKLRFDPRGW